MRKVIVSVYTTLNGVMSPVDWPFPYASAERGKYAHDLLCEADALVMGRETYEIFAAVWPERTTADDGPGEAGSADHINSMAKYVASTTLQHLTWNNSHLITGDVAEEVANMKQQPGQSIVLYGAGPVAHKLLQLGLVDEIRVWVYPLVIGVTEKTKRLFDDASDIPLLNLVETRAFDSGIVVLSYQPHRTT
ncbi:MAG TPA: dihydrofolate reductase family protein [Ktedonobacteraceae bacterium]|nr:dihydrofolate reductase family protein [Ktedonobacteraceae bacterium]